MLIQMKIFRKVRLTILCLYLLIQICHFYNGYLTEDKASTSFCVLQIATLSVGAIVGPYKEQDFLVVSKLLDKKVEAKTSTPHDIFLSRIKVLNE